MTVERSRTTRPIAGQPRGGAIGVWALLLGLLVLAMAIAGLAAAPLYLETAQPRAPLTGEPSPAWPPEGIPLPPRGLATMTVLLVALAAVLVSLGQRYVRAGFTSGGSVLVALSGGVLAGAVVTLAVDLQRAPFRWHEHAYTSVYWVLTGAALTFVAVAVLVVAALFVQLLVGLVDADRHLELTIAAIYVWFTLFAAIALLALVHVHPLVVGS